MILMLLAAVAIPAHAESAAAKNARGNQLYGQGKFPDAEKAYLEAQGVMPRRPELSYNLGNAQIRQKKYEQALRSLRTSISQGSKALQADSWYNVGNAMFDMGRYKDSTQAYIQSLRLNPADRDAKNNLELALRKLQEAGKPPQGQGPDQPPPQQKPEGGQSEDKGKNEPKPQDGKGQSSQDQKEQKPADIQAGRKDQSAGGFSKERALQILDALQNQELAEQRKLLERLVRRTATGKDW